MAVALVLVPRLTRYVFQRSRATPAEKVLFQPGLPQAAATLAVVVTGRQVGLLGEQVVDAVIIVIFLTCLLGPLPTGFAGRRLAARRQVPH